ncbi:MAG TPA: hypothetical protein EYH08_07865 [Pyrodictium sp.]|nr:hypothetical protein [Pyrodictium sp.]
MSSSLARRGEEKVRIEEIDAEGIMEFEPIQDKALIRYKCGRCGSEFTAADIEFMPTLKCPYCGYRVVYKVRAPGRKLVRAI